MTPARQPLPDLVRAFALFGIAVVNVDFFAHATAGGVMTAGWNTPADQVLWWAIASVFLMKSYSLFALMFGFGFEQQRSAAAADGAGFAGRYARRMTGLLALGLLNILALFYGDILVVYAIVGSLLLLFRNLGPQALRRWAIGLYSLQIVAALLIALSTMLLLLPEAATVRDEVLAESAADTASRVAGFAASNPLTVAATRLDAWSSDFVWVVSLQGLGALAFMLYGMHLARCGVLLDPAAPRWSRARRIDLPIGLLLAAAGGWLMVQSRHELDPAYMAGFALAIVGSPFATMGYLGLIAAWAQRSDSPLRAFLVRAGGVSLTAYLLQGLLMSLVFSGYGLGLVGKLGAATYIPIGAAVAIASLAFVGAWRGRHPAGPVENLLRRWVYLGQRRAADTPEAEAKAQSRQTEHPQT
jgi:uncharacterized protein